MKNYRIVDLIAYKQYNSKGMPTIGLTMFGDNNKLVKTIVPSGTSIGSKEALELHDNDKNIFDGKGVDRAIKIINTKIKPMIINKNPLDQKYIDNLLLKVDATFNKSRLGANSIIAISISICKLASKYLNLEPYEYINKYLLKEKKPISFPRILVNVINGGMHAFNNLNFQEFLIIPMKAKSISESCEIASRCFYELNKILVKNKKPNAKGDEGGIDSSFTSEYDALDYIEKSIMNASYIPIKDVMVGIDFAASTFYRKDKYILFDEDRQRKLYNKKELMFYYQNLLKLYPIIYYLEDPFNENDWLSFSSLNYKYHKNKLIVGDDLYCTNIKFLKKGINTKATNSIIIKPNQIGTLTETLNVVDLAKKNKMKIIVSHRSGDSEDDFIADLAVGVCADYLKAGSFARSERVAKYNRLLEIESLINHKK